MDDTLYRGSARYYATGRMPYPAGLADALRDELGLDGHGRLLDVGCGPGSLTGVLAPLFAETVGVDADADMIAEAGRRLPGGVWRVLRAEDLPAGLGVFRVVTFAQSFHWMDRPRVAAIVRTMIESGGAWVHVNASTHRGVDDDTPLPHPRPPHDEIAELIVRYLGPVRRAGRGLLPHGTPGGEEQIMAEAGFRGPVRLDADPGGVRARTEDEVVAGVFSLSGSAPHLFDTRVDEFEADLRALLRSVAPDGHFAERSRATELVVWRP